MIPVRRNRRQVLGSLLGDQRPQGDPKKTGYARLDARIAAMNDPRIGYLDDETRRKVQMYYESSGNPLADSGYAVGLYGISDGAMTDAIRARVIPEGSDPFDPEVNAKVNEFMVDMIGKKDFIANPPRPISDQNRLARIYAAYNQGARKHRLGLEAAKAAGANIYSDDPTEWLMYRKDGEYDGYYFPKETRDYALVLSGVAKADPIRLPKGLYDSIYSD